MPATMNEIGSAAKNTTTVLTQDLQAITNQINTMGRTISAASQNMGATFTDVSDSDTEDELSGKVQSCVNHGAVLGDRNVGGISGAMALENDLDPEDDWAVSGESSMNIATEMRAVVLDCENRGTVTVNKRNGGGLVGWQYMGLVKGSLNAGDVLGSAADYVGGAVGYSSGYLRESSAKCAVYGMRYVGGIGGYGEIVSDCRSVVALTCGEERMGGVLGYAEPRATETDPIVGNFYMIIDTDPGAIDGISYGGRAEPKSHEEFLSLAEIPEPLRTVTVRFVYENGKADTVTLNVGDTLTEDMVPPVPEKPRCAGEWQDIKSALGTEVLFDMEFHVLYIDENAVLESATCRENGRPVVMAQGAYSTAATVSVRETDDAPAAGVNQTVREAWTVRLSEPENTVALRYQLSDPDAADRAELWVRSAEGQWRQVSFRTETSYVIFDFTAEDTAFALLVTPDMTLVWAVLAIGAALLLWQYRDRLKRKK